MKMFQTKKKYEKSRNYLKWNNSALNISRFKCGLCGKTLIAQNS